MLLLAVEAVEVIEVNVVVLVMNWGLMEMVISEKGTSFIQDSII